MTRPSGLTDRESAVAQRVIRGERTKAIAESLVLSPRTVESHLASLFRKFGVSSRGELAALLTAPGERPGWFVGDVPTTRYARAGDVSIAYQVIGSGPVDILVVPGLASHVELIWEQPGWRRFVAALTSVGRVIVYDKRGTGLSDPIDLNRPMTLDQRMADAIAVLDAAGSERAVLLGLSEGGPMSLYAAAAEPDRVTAVCIYGSAVISPDGRERRRRLVSLAEASYGTGVLAGKLWPSLARTEEGKAWLARFERLACSPGMIVRLMEMNIDIDEYGIVDSLHVPVAIVHNVDDAVVPFAEAERLAARLPGAVLVPVHGQDHVPWGDIDIAPLAGALRDLAISARARGHNPGVLRSLVALLDVPEHEHERVVDWVRTCGGRTGAVGSALLGAFDSAGRAVRCAETVSAMVPDLRLAVHVGEVWDTPAVVRGPAVDHVIKLAEDMASPGVWVSGITALLTDHSTPNGQEGGLLLRP